MFYFHYRYVFYYRYVLFSLPLCFRIHYRYVLNFITERHWKKQLCFRITVTVMFQFTTVMFSSSFHQPVKLQPVMFSIHYRYENNTLKITFINHAGIRSLYYTLILHYYNVTYFSKFTKFIYPSHLTLEQTFKHSDHFMNI
jgi:hypothetical protein